MSKEALGNQQSLKTVPFMDLTRQWMTVKGQIWDNFENVFNKSIFCLGPQVEQFEWEVCEYLGSKHAVGLNSGTSAIHLAVKALGLKRGDKVLLPSHTFIGSVWGLVYEGVVPVFCDIFEDSATIDVNSVTQNDLADVKAILAVHIYGQSGNFQRILDFAKEHNLFVIEDCAQAFGANFKNKKLGAVGDVGCFSFYPGKNLGGAGEAGLLVTNSDTVASRARMLRDHGQTQKYHHEEIGFNYRMDGLQAAVLSAKLAYLDAWNDERKEIAEYYSRSLSGCPLEIPSKVGSDHVWHLFVVRTSGRDELKQYLDGLGISTGLHYPVPLHRQKCLQGLHEKIGSLAQTEDWADRCLSLPIFPGMRRSQMDQVVSGINDFFLEV